MGGWETMEAAASTARSGGSFGFAKSGKIASVAVMKFSGLSLCALLAVCQPTEAVVVASGGPNNTAPGGQPFFQNVGSIGSASAIYLGDGWVLSANHVAGSLPGSVNFGGVGYTTQAGSFHRLENPVYSPTLSLLTDIVVFRLSAPLALPGVTISNATPTVGSQVMMIGNGSTQVGPPTFWNRTVIPGDGNDTWVVTTEALSNIAGYQTTGAREIRWGENVVNDDNFTANAGHGDVISFSTQFDAVGLTHEAQGVPGDSGGAVFSFNGSSWELSGMMHAVSSYENQPGGVDTAVFGVETAIADLSYYRTQILTIIPEPSSALLTMLGGLVLFRRRR
jgi:hypothetical protein